MAEAMRRVIITGSRDGYDPAMIRHDLEDLVGHSPITVIHGGARGVDRTAGEIARSMGIPVEEYPADWRSHGRGAGPIRNAEMLARGADMVIAYKQGFDSSLQHGGTEHMVRIAGNVGVPIIIRSV